MGKTDNKTIDTERSTAGSKNYSDTESATGENKRGRGRPRKTESEPGGKETESNIPRLVLVDVPETDQIDQEETIPAPTKNPAKRKRKDIQFELKKEQLSVLIKTVFDIAGSREGMEVWKITQKESDLIADPLTGILNKNPVIGKITSEYGDLIALVVAVATVLLPRVMMQYSMKKTKEGVKPYVAISEPNRKPTNPGKHNETGKNGNHLEQSTRKPSFTGQDASNQLHNLIPSIQ